jgi:hypothetical protein
VPSISVHVDAPEGLPPHSVTVIYKPATADEFERIVEAAGGPLAFRALGDFAYATLDGGVTIHLFEPKDAAPPAPAPHPFMQAFAERIGECRAFKEKLEAAGGES